MNFRIADGEDGAFQVIRLALGLAVSVAGISFGTTAFSGNAVVEEYGGFRTITIRRHNDIEGAEAVFDDYRRNWFRQGFSGVRVGDGSLDETPDMPRCNKHHSGSGAVHNRINCGSNHIFRMNVTGIVASDEFTASTNEVGGLAYLGYEYLFDNDAFLGLGFSYSQSDIDSSFRGDRLDATARDYGAHFVGGYRFPHDIGVAWNISAVRTDDDLTRNGSITSDLEATSAMISGVVFQKRDLTENTYISYGLDYTFLGVFGAGTVTDSSATVQDTGINNPRGDFTGSLLLVHTLDEGEVFARLGSTAEVILATDRWIDATLDLGGSYNLTDSVALTGTIGGTYRKSDYFSGRAGLRLVGKF